MSYSKKYILVALSLIISHGSCAPWPFSTPTQDAIDADYQEEMATNKANRKSRKVNADALYTEEKTTAQASRKKQQNKLDAKNKRKNDKTKAQKKSNRSRQRQIDADEDDSLTIVF